MRLTEAAASWAWSAMHSGICSAAKRDAVACRAGTPQINLDQPRVLPQGEAEKSAGTGDRASTICAICYAGQMSLCGPDDLARCR